MFRACCCDLIPRSTHLRPRVKNGTHSTMKPPVCGAKVDVVVRREDPSGQVPTPVPGGIWSHQVVAQQQGGPRGGGAQ